MLDAIPCSLIAFIERLESLPKLPNLYRMCAAYLIGDTLILKCAGCGNSIDVILSGVPIKTGETGDWKLSMLIYRGEVCECTLSIRNPEKTEEVKRYALKNPEKYKNTIDQIMSTDKRPNANKQE